eukprot:g7569.t1
MAKKKSEPAERIRQLMESIQGGGGKNEPKAHAFAGRHASTSTENSTPRVVGGAQAVESPAASVPTHDSGPQEEETERRKQQGINRSHFLSNDGLHAIDDEPDEEQVTVMRYDAGPPHGFGDYSGHVQGGVPHGKGTMQWPSGKEYRGSGRRGRETGRWVRGVFTYPDGKTYSGQWLNGLRHGEGTRNYPDGSTYTGSWAYDKRHGQGEYTWMDGRVWSGEWREGNPVKNKPYRSESKEQHVRHPSDGSALMASELDLSGSNNDSTTTSNGTGHTTTCSSNSSGGGLGSGTGGGGGSSFSPAPVEMSYDTGLPLGVGEYVGHVKDGAPHGQGTIEWPQGKRYTGAWKDGKRTGYGTFSSDDGRVHQGEWVNNKAHGKGTFWFGDGTSYTGGWVDGLKHGQGVRTYPGGVMYDGAWVNGSRHGKGVWCGPDGMYEGEYRNDKKNGFGTYTWADGRKHVGNWQDGKQHGKGVLYARDGKITIQGKWKKGEKTLFF